MTSPAWWYEVPAVETRGRLSLADWIDSRARALLTVLRQRGVTSGRSRMVLPALLALMWLETGAGTGEFGFNLTNIVPSRARSPSWQGAYHRLVTAKGARYFRAYPTLLEGATDLMWLLERQRYAGAWLALLQGGEAGAFYLAVTGAGYTPGEETDLVQYRGLVRRLGGQHPELANVWW